MGSFGFKKALGSVISLGADAIVPGSGSIVSGAVGLGEDELNAQYQYKLNQKAADANYQRNLQMWNLQNAYNDPAAQMERLKAAGLNPNLVYGGGNVTGNTSGSAPTYDVAPAKYSDNRIQREQLALAMKEHQQRITNQAIENDLARQRLSLAERDANRSDALAQAQISALKAGLGLTQANISRIEGDMSDYSRSWQHYQERLKDWRAGMKSYMSQHPNHTLSDYERYHKRPVFLYDIE